jgi:hypothetical protein
VLQPFRKPGGVGWVGREAEAQWGGGEQASWGGREVAVAGPKTGAGSKFKKGNPFEFYLKFGFLANF